MNGLAQCAIIGSTPDDRLNYALKLRRLGIPTFTETAQRKANRMFERACAENVWGKGGVYDLDDDGDRAWLDRDDLPEVGV